MALSRTRKALVGVGVASAAVLAFVLSLPGTSYDAHDLPSLPPDDQNGWAPIRDAPDGSFRRPAAAIGWMSRVSLLGEHDLERAREDVGTVEPTTDETERLEEAFSRPYFVIACGAEPPRPPCPILRARAALQTAVAIAAREALDGDVHRAVERTIELARVARGGAGSSRSVLAAMVVEAALDDVVELVGLVAAAMRSRATATADADLGRLEAELDRIGAEDGMPESAIIGTAISDDLPDEYTRALVSFARAGTPRPDPPWWIFGDLTNALAWSAQRATARRETIDCARAEIAATRSGEPLE